MKTDTKGLVLRRSNASPVTPILSNRVDRRLVFRRAVPLLAVAVLASVLVSRLHGTLPAVAEAGTFVVIVGTVAATLLLRPRNAATTEAAATELPASKPDPRFERYRELQRALEDGEFLLFYQPEVSLSTQRVAALEALIRWQRPDGSLAPPSDFIPFAEEMGIVKQIGTWALREACVQAAQWRAAVPGCEELRISVNMSAVQLEDPKFVSVVETALRDSGLEPDALIIEVTETMLITDPKVFRVTLAELHRLGVRFAVDDFGTGYASFSYLQAFRFDYVKVAERFISPIELNNADTSLISGLIGLTKGLGALVIAEGVETKKQAYVCKVLGVDLVQGFYYSPPLPAAEVERLLGAPMLAASA